MFSPNDQRGVCGVEKYACLVLVLLAFSFIFITLRLIPVDPGLNLKRIIDRAALHCWSDQLIEQQVLCWLRFQLSSSPQARGVHITRSSLDQGDRKLALDVTYRKAVQLPGYIHTFKFRSTVVTFMEEL